MSCIILALLAGFLSGVFVMLFLWAYVFMSDAGCILIIELLEFIARHKEDAK